MSRCIDADALADKAKEFGGYYEDTVYAVPLADISDAPSIETKQIKYFDEDEKVWKIGSVIVNETD